MQIRKLKNNYEVDQVRVKILAKQKYVCPLCKGSLKVKRPAMDHDHKTGFLRDVLCINCNGMEGQIFNRANRAKADLTVIQWLQNLVDYWVRHEEPRYNLIHPEHKTEAEKKAAKKKPSAKKPTRKSPTRKVPK